MEEEIVEIVLILSLLSCGVVFVGISIPLILEKIPPNHWYGIRVRKTLANKGIWYKANKYSGRDFCVIGFMLVLAALMLLIFRESIRLFVLVPIVLALTVVPVMVAVVRALLYVRKL